MNLDSGRVIMGAAWRVWYAHGFSSEQWVPVPVEDDALKEGVLVVSKAAVSGVVCW